MAPNRTNSEQYLSDAVGFLVATHTGATRNSQEIKALAALSISQLMISTIQQRAFVWHPTADRIEEPRKAKVPAKQRQIGCCQTNVHTSSKLPRFVAQTLRAPRGTGLWLRPGSPHRGQSHNRLSGAQRVYSVSGAWSTWTPVECVFDNGGGTPVRKTHR
jgi:hypothetical protein